MMAHDQRDDGDDADGVVLPTPVPSSDQIAIIARALLDRFGDRASAVAEFQLKEASGGARRSWALILADIDRQTAFPTD